MLEELDIREGEVTDKEYKRLDGLGLSGFRKLAAARAHILIQPGSRERYDFTLPLFYVPHMDAIEGDFEDGEPKGKDNGSGGHKRLNAIESVGGKFPRRIFGVFSSKKHRAVFRSAAFPYMLPNDAEHDPEIGSKIVEIHNLHLGVEIGLRNLNAAHRKLPVNPIVALIRVPFPRGFLYGVEEQGVAIKYLHDETKSALLEGLRVEANRVGYNLLENPSNAYKDIYRFGLDSHQVVLAGGFRSFEKSR